MTTTKRFGTYTPEEIDSAVDAFAAIPASSATFVSGGATDGGEPPEVIPNEVISVFQAAGNKDSATPRVAFAMEGSIASFQDAAALKNLKRVYAYLTPEDALTLARRLIRAAGEATSAAQGLNPLPLPGTIRTTDSESP